VISTSIGSDKCSLDRDGAARMLDRKEISSEQPQRAEALPSATASASPVNLINRLCFNTDHGLSFSRKHHRMRATQRLGCTAF
jgi:hypothetical protein